MDVTTTGLKDAMYRPASRARSAVNPQAPVEFPWLRVNEVLLDVLTVFSCIELGFHVACLKIVDFPVTGKDHWAFIALIFSWVMVILLDRGGAYRTSGGLLRLRETASVLEASFLAVMVVIPCMLLFRTASWIQLALLETVLVTAGLVLQKQLFHTLIARMRSKDSDGRRVLIYGAGQSARMLFSALARSPKLGFSPIALVDDETEERFDEVRRGSESVPVLRAEFSAALVRQHRAEVVVISSPFSSKAYLQHVIEASTEAGAHVVYGSETSSLGHTEVDYIELDGQFVYGEHRVRTHRIYELMSRGLDIVVSSVMLVFAAIPLLLAALAVRLESEGPIYFRQIRIGRDGMPFTILKFRTMYERLCGDSVSPADSTDPRITKVGRWLRRTSLDELPQLLNVLRGDMALVGPRPEMPFIVAGYSDYQRQRLSVKPGLTGIWQISADRRYPIHENLHYDLYYLKHRSLAMDVAVLFHTLLFAVNGS
jgi:exopolysaccharide biosynthesis polyprenyl glycosylphosphotransferase